METTIESTCPTCDTSIQVTGRAGDPKIESLVECDDSWHVCDMPWCCYLSPPGTKEGIRSCGKDAEFEIWNDSPGADMYDYTHACSDHVGHLLGSCNEVEAIGWRVTPI